MSHDGLLDMAFPSAKPVLCCHVRRGAAIELKSSRPRSIIGSEGRLRSGSQKGQAAHASRPSLCAVKPGCVAVSRPRDQRLPDAATFRKLRYQAHGATIILGALVLADVDRPRYRKRIVDGQRYSNILPGANFGRDLRGSFGRVGSVPLDKLDFFDRRTTATL